MKIAASLIFALLILFGASIREQRITIVEDYFLSHRTTDYLFRSLLWQKPPQRDATTLLKREPISFFSFEVRDYSCYGLWKHEDTWSINVQCKSY